MIKIEVKYLVFTPYTTDDDVNDELLANRQRQHRTQR